MSSSEYEIYEKLLEIGLSEEQIEKEMEKKYRTSDIAELVLEAMGEKTQ